MTRSFVVLLALLAFSASANQLAGGLFNTVCPGDKVDGRELSLPELKENNCASANTHCKFVNDPHLYVDNKWVAEAQKAGYNWVAYHMDEKNPIRVQMVTSPGNNAWNAAGGIAIHLPNGNFFSVVGRNEVKINCKPASAQQLTDNGITVAGASYAVKIGRTHIAYAFQSLQVNTPECTLRKSHGWCSAKWNTNFQSCLYAVAGKNPAYVKNEHNYFNCQTGLQDEITKKQKDDVKKEPEIVKCTDADNARNARSCEAALGQFNDQKCSKKRFIDSCAADLCINKPDLHEGLLRITQRNYLMHFGGIDRCLDKIVPKGECKTGKRKDYLHECYKQLDNYDTMICDKTNYVKNCMEDMCKKDVAEHKNILKEMQVGYLKTFGGEAKCAKTAEIKRQQEKTEQLTKTWQKLLHEQHVHVQNIHKKTTEKHTTIITNKITTIQKIFTNELNSMKKEIKLMSASLKALANKKPKKQRKPIRININIKNGGGRYSKKYYRSLAAREARLRRKELMLNKIRRSVLLRKLKYIIHHRRVYHSYRHLPTNWLNDTHRKFKAVFSNWKSICDEYKPEEPKRSPK